MRRYRFGINPILTTLPTENTLSYPTANGDRGKSISVFNLEAVTTE
jgi:hypothetical protein